MKERTLKWIIFFETLLILLLLIKVWYQPVKAPVAARDPNEFLLSKRVYTGLLPSKSYLATNFYPLENALNGYLKDNNLNVSIYVENLNNGANFGINEDDASFPGSINKIPIAILILQKAEQGELDLNNRITPSGPTIRTLLERMLKDSDNEAFGDLATLVDTSEIKKAMNYYGIDFYGAYDPNKTQNKENLLGPRQLSQIFSSLYFSTLLNSSDSEYILRLLSNTSFPLKDRAHLPENATLAHKFGEYYVEENEFFHDCGIIYTAELRLSYCIMTRNMSEPKAIVVVSEILNTIYTYATDLRSHLNEYRDQGHL